MSDERRCPKCSGTMIQGPLKEIGHYGNSPFEWAPQDDLPFLVTGQPSKRRPVVAHRCESCGYLELSAP